MQNSEVMIRGAFRDFKPIQKNTKKGRRGDEEKTHGGGARLKGVCGSSFRVAMFIFHSPARLFHILPFSSII